MTHATQSPQKANTMLKYSHSSRGYLQEVTLIPRDQWGTHSPKAGCDILIFDTANRCVSAKSCDYFDTKEQAVVAFAEKQRIALSRSKERLRREQESLERATVQPAIQSPLNLSPYRQSWLAAIASKARSVKYDYDAASRPAPDFAELGEWFAIHIVESILEPQDFDDMYDRLHRSGSNA